jgi:hypothetical protein
VSLPNRYVDWLIRPRGSANGFELIVCSMFSDWPLCCSTHLPEDEVDDLMVIRGTTIAVAEHNKCGPLERDLSGLLSSEADFFHKGAPFDVIETCLAPSDVADEEDGDAEDDYR